MKRIFARMLGIVVLAALLACMAGCGEGQPVSKEGNEETVRIVTSFYPMYVLTLNVTKDIEGVEVVNMAQAQTGCLHDYQLSTADLKVLDTADILVINGAGMESFLDKITEEMPQLKVITASEGIDLLDDEHEMHQAEGAKNPHVWVSPSLAAQEVRTIAAGLAEADGLHAAQYTANAEAFAAELEMLSAEMKTALDTLPHRKIVTFHEAFPYFAREFQLEIAAVVENEPGQEPVAKEMDALIRTIQQEKIPAVFVESQYADTTARLIAEETGAAIYELDLLVLGDEEASAEDVRGAYEKAMRANLAVLMEALQ